MLRTTRVQGGALAFLGFLLVVLVVALNFRGAMPPLQDFNEWIYQGWLIGGLLRGEAVPFGVKPWPVPNAAGQVLLGVLNVPLGARAAGLAYLTLYAAGMTWLAVAVARAGGRFEAGVFLLALLIGGFNSPYWDGYANSQLGAALYVMHVLRERRWGTSAAWDLVLGVVIFFCHAVLLAVFALHVLLRAWLGGGWRRVWVLVPPFALLGWYLVRDENYGEAIPAFGTSVWEFVAYKVYTAAKLGPYQNMVVGGVGDAGRAPWLYWAGVGVNLAFAVVVLGPLLVGLWRRKWRDPAVLTAGACIAGFAVLPSAMFGVVNVGERLLVPAVLVLLALCPDVWRMRRIGAGIAALAPAMVLYFHLILPAVPPEGAIGHLAAHDPEQRSRLLFWHRPFQFARQIEAAERGEAIRLGFTTSLMRPVAR